MRENTDKNNFKYGHFLRSTNHSEQCITHNKVQERISNPVKHLLWSFFRKIDNRFYPLTISAKHSIIYICQGPK